MYTYCFKPVYLYDTCNNFTTNNYVQHLITIIIIIILYFIKSNADCNQNDDM